MKKQILFLLFICLTASSFSQTSLRPVKIIDTTFNYTQTILKQKPFYHKGFLRGRHYNHCGLEMTVRLGIGLLNDKQIILTSNDLLGNSKPITLTTDKDKFNSNLINQFLDSSIMLFSKQNYLDNCVKNFNNYNSESIFKSIDLVKTSSKASQTTLFTTFPFGAVAGGTYTITRADASISSGGTLYLPVNFTINVAPDVDKVDWYFDKIQFDEGATIDLSRIITFPNPVKATDGTNMRDCNESVNSCCFGDRGDNRPLQSGGDGQPSHNGVNGKDGTILILSTHYIPSSGNLWIRTDGAKGEDGGSGGNGGNGNWGNCDGGNYHNGGSGGKGGDAGNGGNGGNTSVINFRLLDPQTGQVVRDFKGSCSNSTTPSTRPSSASGSTGVIAVYGNPGAKGLKGNPGIGGERGHSCPNCGLLGRQDTDGAEGVNGTNGTNGHDGTCNTGN